jgi:hypothetical protein
MKYFAKTKKGVHILLICSLPWILIAGCSKDKNPVKPTDNTKDSYVTESVKTQPTFFSFAKMATVTTFDLMFHLVNRSPDIALNSGPNGSAGVTAKDLGAVDFDAEADINNGFVADSANSSVIADSWYNYDITTHTISSKNNIYLIKSVDYQTYKLKFNSYHSGVWNITFSPVNDNGQPTSTQTGDVSATDTEPAFFSLTTGKAGKIEQWDVAFLTILLYIPEMGASIRNPAVILNSVAGVQVASVSTPSFDQLKTVPGTVTWDQDQPGDLAIGDKVFNYDSQTHRLTPQDVTYLVQTTSGQYAKFKVTSYYHPETGESGFINFRAAKL